MKKQKRKLWITNFFKFNKKYFNITRIRDENQNYN